MTTLDHSNLTMDNNAFMNDPHSYEGYNASPGFASQHSAPSSSMTSPHFSPSVGSGSHQEDYNQLLEAWTHNSFGSSSNSAEEMYSSAMSSQQQYPNDGGNGNNRGFLNQPQSAFSSNNNLNHQQQQQQHVRPFQSVAPSQQEHSASPPYMHPTIFHPSAPSAASNFPQHGENSGLGFTGDLRIHHSHYDPPSTASSTSSSASSGLFVNEQIPQSISPQESISSSSSSSSNTTTTHNTASSQMQGQQYASRESPWPLSRRSTLDSSVAASQIASLSLNSPHHSVSTGSSSTSSSQNSPTTPLSAYGYDSQTGGVLSFQQQQQQLLLHHQQNLINTKNLQGLASSSANPMPGSVHPGFLHGTGFNSQTAGVPPSQISPTQTNFQASMPMSQSHSRMSSAGLMDQVVSSRKAIASPTEPETDQMPSINGILNKQVSEDMKKSLSRSTTTRARSRTSSTPPTTPGRTTTKTFRNNGSNALTASASTPNALAESIIGNAGQTPSSVGPHRTPSKRGLAMSTNGPAAECLNISPVPSVNAALSPQRPNIRRTASHTPKSNRKGSTPAALTMSSGLASPAEMQLRAQQAAHFVNMQPDQKARIANVEAELELTSANAATMMRAMSSPSYANNSSNSIFASSTNGQGGAGPISRPSSRDSADPSNNNNLNYNRNRRSSTLSGLQMSALPSSAIGTTSLNNASDIYSRQHQLHQSRKAASSSPVNTVSYAEALLALDQVDAFLEGQAKQLNSAQNQQPALALGTQDQLRGIRDIRQRIQTRLANGIIS